jgi:MoxR-like ATPase
MGDADIARFPKREPGESFLLKYRKMAGEIHREVLELDDVMEKIFIAMLGDGHVILEGEPGVGKTLLARTLARTIDVPCSYIQFTPETMPQDLLYSLGGFGESAAGETLREMRLRKGPIFSRIVIGDEINRAIPRIHSAIMSPLQEKVVSLEGKVHDLGPFYFWIATQNPVESSETTSMLPEALQERFMLMVKVPYPGADLLRRIAIHDTRPKKIEEVFGMEEIVSLQSAIMEHYVLTRDRENPVISYVQRLVSAVHGHPAVRWGPGVRAAQDLTRASAAHAFIHGNDRITFGDVKAMAMPAMRFKFQVDARKARRHVPRITHNDDIITEALRSVGIAAEGEQDVA